MLLRFGIQNHLSIRHRQELVLTAAKRVKRSGTVEPVPILGEYAVPVAVLYGANASGKSNLLHALRVMRSHIALSHKSGDATDPIEQHPFLLDQGSTDRPTQFDCMFTVQDHDAGTPQEVYEYGFSCNGTEYTDEWLRRIVRHRRQTAQMLFKRATVDGKVQVDVGANLRGENRAIAALTRPNSLFLSAAAQNSHPQLATIQREFVEKWRGRWREASNLDVADSFARFEHQDALMALMRQADLGIVGRELEEYELPESERNKIKALQRALSDITGSSPAFDDPARPRKLLRFTHTSDTGGRPIDYEWESFGTRRFASLATPVLNAIYGGQLVVADELDGSLHHRLAVALLKLFKSATNRHGAQLIATLHDTAPLGDGLELDEVWLAEKDATGASSYRPLTDYRIRSRDDIERLYREGRLGGAPVVGDLALALDD